jgi:O-antigen/teichoic acid export membrane protein
MKRDYALTFAAEFLVLGAGLLVFRLAAAYWTPDRFAEYVLARRVLALIQGSVSLGLGVSIPRYVALARATPGGAQSPKCYLASGLVLAIPTLAAVAAAFALAPGTVAKALLGDAKYTVLLPPLYLCLSGMMLHTLAYGYFRGCLNMAAANSLQVLNQGAAHLAPFALAGFEPSEVFVAVGTIWLVSAGTTLLTALVHDWPLRSGCSLPRYGWELLRYGAPRMPGDIVLSTLFNLPATLAAHVGTIRDAGYVAFSLSALSLVGGLFAPVGLVLLPGAAAKMARGEQARLRHGLRRLVTAGILMTLAGVVVVELIATPLVQWYLGPAYAAAATPLRLVMLGAVPYVAYVLVRSALDALSVRAINTRNLAVGLVLFALVAWTWHSVNGVVIALSAAMATTGILSLLEIRKLLRPPPGGVDGVAPAPPQS